MPTPPLRIGLTGGIGSGKSTVAGTLLEAGAVIIDADAISRSTTAPGGPAMPLIGAEFGPGMIAADGGLDRDRMRELAFRDAGARLRLEAIIHPLVAHETALQHDRARQSGAACVVFDVPLLVESGRWRRLVDRVLVVDCTEATQLERVVARNGWAPEVVLKIMAGQATRARRLAVADACIFNDGIGLGELNRQVRQLAAGFGL